MSLMTGKQNINPGKNLVRFCIWIVELFGSEAWILGTVEQNYLGDLSFFIGGE